MSTNNEEHIPLIDGKTPVDISGNYQPIHLEDTAGAIFLGILAVIMLIGWRRAETRCQKLILQQKMMDIKSIT
jgi:hypothetical protein